MRTTRVRHPCNNESLIGDILCIHRGNAIPIAVSCFEIRREVALCKGMTDGPAVLDAGHWFSRVLSYQFHHIFTLEFNSSQFLCRISRFFSIIILVNETNLTLGLPRGHFDPSEKTFRYFSSRKFVFQECQKTLRNLPYLMRIF